MLNIPTIIEDLKHLKTRPQMFVSPLTPESLQSYFGGMKRVVYLLDDSLFIYKVRNGEQFRLLLRKEGLHDDTGGPFRSLREKGWSDEQIIEKMIDVEIEYWRIAEKQ